MNKVQQVPVATTDYKVVKPFLHQHKSMAVGDPLSLTKRAAQHLVHAEFIEEVAAKSTVVGTEGAKDKAAKK